jgi:nickel/cobalt tolerance cation efflux system protein
MAVAIGAVVDDSIVDMENCCRGLRINQFQGNPKHPFQVMYDTSVEVRLGSLFTSTALTLLVIPAIYAKFGKWLISKSKSLSVDIRSSLEAELSYTPSMLKTLVFNMDKKKNPKRGFALRPSRKTTGFMIDAV